MCLWSVDDQQMNASWDVMSRERMAAALQPSAAVGVWGGLYVAAPAAGRPVRAGTKKCGWGLVSLGRMLFVPHMYRYAKRRRRTQVH